MTKAIPKLAAMVGAAALVATMALPAAASSQSQAEIQRSSGALQTLEPTVAGASAVSREEYGITAKPQPKPQPKAPPTVVAATLAGFANSSANRFSTVNAPAQTYSGAAILQYGSQFVGVVPYGMGNTPTTSFSCDGFTQYVFAGFGIALPRGADHQAALGVRISKADAVAGDLVWWPGQHIGIYDGAGGMYNSPTWGRYVEHVAQLWGSPVFIRLR